MRPRSFRLPVLGLLLAALPAVSQNPQPAPTSAPATAADLSPGAAYSDAMHPLDATRAVIANWSDIELAAMKVSIARAKTACDARTAASYTGADLIDFVRLCALGQEWPVVAAAAHRYIAGLDASKPQLAEAYTSAVGAELRRHAEPTALLDAEAMLAAVPYTLQVAESTDETLTYMRFVHTADAVELASHRQPLLLDLLRIPGPAAGSVPGPAAGSVPGPPATGSDAAPAPLPTHLLYRQGLDLAKLQLLSAQPEAAAAAKEALDAALPPALPPDEALPVAAARRQYALLGKPCPTWLPRLRSRPSPASCPPFPPTVP